MSTNRFTDQFKVANDAFRNEYAAALKQLEGLSQDDLDLITPDTTNKQAYEALINEVKKATTGNMAQAQLISNIKALGDVAVKIAKKIPGLL